MGPMSRGKVHEKKKKEMKFYILLFGKTILDIKKLLFTLNRKMSQARFFMFQVIMSQILCINLIS